MQGTGPGVTVSDALHPDFAAKLAALMEMTDRDGYEEPKEGIEAGKPVRRSIQTGGVGRERLDWRSTSQSFQEHSCLSPAKPSAP